MVDQKYLEPGKYIDSNHPAVVSYAHENAGEASTVRQRVLNFYYTIRDTIRYDPYMPIANPASYRASDAVITKRGWCVPKAALLAACCRAYTAFQLALVMQMLGITWLLKDYWIY